MLDHIGIRCADFTRSLSFFQQALAPLGITVVMQVSLGMGKIFHGGFDDAPSWSVPWETPKAPAYASEAALKMVADPANIDKKGRARGPAVESADVPDDTYTDGKTARLAAKTLGELKQKGQPFFLAVGMAKPHLPFVAPKKYWDLYDPAKIYVPAFQKLPAGTPEFVGHNNSELKSYADIAKGGTRWHLFKLALRLALRRVQAGRDIDMLYARDITVETARRRPRVAFDGEKRKMLAPLNFRIHDDALSIILPDEADKVDA